MNGVFKIVLTSSKQQYYETDLRSKVIEFKKSLQSLEQYENYPITRKLPEVICKFKATRNLISLRNVKITRKYSKNRKLPKITQKFEITRKPKLLYLNNDTRPGPTCFSSNNGDSYILHKVFPNVGPSKGRVDIPARRIGLKLLIQRPTWFNKSQMPNVILVVCF